MASGDTGDKSMSWFSGNGRKARKVKKHYLDPDDDLKNGEDTKPIPLPAPKVDDFEEDDFDAEEANHKLKKRVIVLETRLAETIAKKDFEIEMLRKQCDANTIFLQEIILKLIDKPAPESSSSSRLPDRYRKLKDDDVRTSSEKELNRGAKKVEVTDSLAGPRGRLP